MIILSNCNLTLDDYTYQLPEEQVVKYPNKKREEANLLVYKNENINITKFKNFTDFITPNALLVFNNTRVIYARLGFRKKSGAKIEIFCLRPYNPLDYEKNFASTKQCIWRCLVKNAKKWKDEILEISSTIKNIKVCLRATKLKSGKRSFLIQFDWTNNIKFISILENFGKIPIPPYLKRDSIAIDKKRYQTVFAQNNGSVAAPTAGLHFTPDILNALKSKNIKSTLLTLHVSAGTFQPIKNKDILNHNMHEENFSFTIETLKKIYTNLGNIIAVGTTSVRSLESIYHIGRKIYQNHENPFNISQWEIYNENLITADKAIQSLITYMEDNNLNNYNATTKILILPGYKFKMIKGMLTNFHLPQSTLLLLVSAWIGNSWKKIYQSAINHNFRFLSYGDTSLLFR